MQAAHQVGEIAALNDPSVWAWLNSCVKPVVHAISRFGRGPCAKASDGPKSIMAASNLTRGGRGDRNGHLPAAASFEFPPFFGPFGGESFALMGHSDAGPSK
jgi:hypothetical protein